MVSPGTGPTCSPEPLLKGCLVAGVKLLMSNHARMGKNPPYFPIGHFLPFPALYGCTCAGPELFSRNTLGCCCV